MTDVRAAWNEAGERLQGLGASLKHHYEQQRGEDAGQTKEQVGDAFKKVGDALQSAFEALGAAAKDPAVKEDVKQTGKSVAAALTVTFSELSDDVRKAFDKRKGEARREGAEPGGEPAPTTVAAEPGAPDAGAAQDDAQAPAQADAQAPAEADAPTGEDPPKPDPAAQI